MLKIILDTIAVLNKKEQRTLGRLTLFHTLVSLADIGSLVLLLALIHLYTATGVAERGTLWHTWTSGMQQLHFLLPIVLFLLLFICKNIAAYLAFRNQYRFVYKVALRLSGNNLQQYFDSPYQEYASTDSSVQINKISYQPMEFCSYILSGMQQMFTELTLTLIAVTAVLLFNAKLFLLLLLLLLPPVLLAAWLSRKRLNDARNNVKESAEKTTQYLQEALGGFVEGNVYDRKTFFLRRYSGSQRKLNNALAQLQITQAIPSRFIEVFAVLGLLIMIMVNKYGQGLTTELINIGAFMAAAYKIIPGITRIANISTQMRMFAYTIRKPDAAEATAVTTLNQVSDRVDSIAFHDVTFAHDPQHRLEQINLKVRKGDFLGIFAASGKGKTTLLHLLLGFLEPDKGSIAINGNNAAAAARQLYWRDMAYVKQQNFLIHDTLRNNITLDEERCDVQRLQESVSRAGLDDFLKTLPEGLNKVIADNGKNISGGQRQRIALARAFYKQAQVLLLDEPFSELDESSEESLLTYLRSLAGQGRMVILITHNKSNLKYCNKLFSFHA